MVPENDYIKTNSLNAWILAARPKTLTGAMVPVMIGTAWAWKIGGAANFRILPALLCFLFAFLMQIDSNFINDYFDCVKGNDDRSTRLGPKRACSEGWITLPAMRIGLVITSLLACFIGLPLIIYGGWEMIIVGAVCVLFAFLYTTYFSYLGLGDLLQLEVFITGIACGLVIDTLLVVNNYRDRDNDKRDGKITLIVRLGTKRAEKFYSALGIFAYFLMFYALFFSNNNLLFTLLFILFYTPYILLHKRTANFMVRINQGKDLNIVLAKTARNILIYGITTSAAILFL